IFSKIDTDSRDGHNESLRGYVYPMIAQELIRRISRGSPFHSLRLFFVPLSYVKLDHFDRQL
ncbi:hypothetical protein N8Y50_26380, partial [Enterobacter hormaechei subsp. steigerwaltii]|nr:hypothetical protein [Enterobacter hormaechei subsp. steigerwaltii]